MYRALHEYMRALGVGSVIFAIGCSASHPSDGNPPGGGTGTLPDARGSTIADGGGETTPGADAAGASDAMSAPDARLAALGPNAIVFAGALDGQAVTDLYVVDGATVTRLTQTAGGELYPTISPDRLHIAFVRDFQLFTIDVAGHGERLVAAKTGRQRFAANGDVWKTTLGPAAWSPDGTRLAYLYPRDPYPNNDPSDPVDESMGTTLHVVNVDGTGDYLVPNVPMGTVNSIAWSGDTISFSFDYGDCPDCAGTQAYGFLKPDGTGYSSMQWTWPSGNPTPWKHLYWSPDGQRWTFEIASHSNDIPYEEPDPIYTSTAFTDDARPLIATATAWNPRWSLDGTRIAYIGSDGIYTIAATGGTATRVLAATGLRGLDW